MACTAAPFRGLPEPLPSLPAAEVPPVLFRGETTGGAADCGRWCVMGAAVVVGGGVEKSALLEVRAIALAEESCRELSLHAATASAWSAAAASKYTLDQMGSPLPHHHTSPSDVTCTVKVAPAATATTAHALAPCASGRLSWSSRNMEEKVEGEEGEEEAPAPPPPMLLPPDQ